MEMEVIMFSKMWCVGFIVAGLFIKPLQAEEIINISFEERITTISGTITLDTLNLKGIMEPEKMLLIEEITTLVKPHLSQTEMERLSSLLQVLASKVRVHTLFEIHKKLKVSLKRFGFFACLGLAKQKSAAENSSAPANPTEALQANLCQVLERINLSQYEALIRKYAAQISEIICKTLAEELPAECLPVVADTIATINKLKRPEEIQQVLTDFVRKHADALPAL